MKFAVSAWKEQRKMMNPCFNLKIINSFHDTFAKYSRKMVNFLDATEGSEQTNLLSVIWKSTYDSAIGKKYMYACLLCTFELFLYHCNCSRQLF